MSGTSPRRRGAPLGNQNARKHGYYSRFVSIGRKMYYLGSEASLDIDEQIVFAVAKVRSICRTGAVNARLLERARGTLRRLSREQARAKARDIMPSSQNAQVHPASRRVQRQ